MASDRSFSDNNAEGYVLPVFVDDTMFSHNFANGPEFHDAHASSSSPCGGIGAKSAVSDCILLKLEFTTKVS